MEGRQGDQRRGARRARDFEPGIDPELYETGGSRAACLLYKPDLRHVGPRRSDFCRLPKDTAARSGRLRESTATGRDSMRLGRWVSYWRAPCLALPAGAWAADFPPPIDKQVVQDQDDMTWADYRPVPGTNWADPSLVPTGAQAEDRGRGGRLLRPAVRDHAAQAQRSVRQPADRSGSRASDVPKFYADFNGKPSASTTGHTVREYWMEQTNGRIGMTLHAVRAVPDAAPAVRVRPQRVQPERHRGRDTAAAARPGTPATATWTATSTRSGPPTTAEHPPTSSTSSCASTPATTRRPSGRSSAR